MLRCKRATVSMSWRSLSQSAMVGREVGGGEGRTQSGVRMVEAKGARSRMWRACGRIAGELRDYKRGGGGSCTSIWRPSRSSKNHS